ncbi:hypothetical protein EDB89DRAFT_2062445 [Lactarius sanguifluus]|nr:hypothetical protein EDB89DRAFT_2062445 [Lactarius sanguifluus]
MSPLTLTLNSLTNNSTAMSEHEPTTTMDDLPVEPNLEEYLKSKEFDQECAVQFQRSLSDSSNSSEDSIWSNWNDSTSSVSSVEPPPHEVPKVEANLYYAGLSPNGRGPKLIYRTSNDKFIEAKGPRAYKRLMRLCPIPEDHELGQDGRWDCIRDQVVELLDKGGIKLTSVDLVQFTWLDENDDQEIQEEEDDDDNDVQNDNLTYDDIPLIKPAHRSATEILGLLKELGIAGVDVAYRESVAKFLHAPGLFAPASDLDPLKDVIDNLSTPLSLPIAGRKTPMQGTLCCYFRVGNNLYATTARHNVFPLSGDNKEYNYVESAPKMEVVVMGNPAFTNYLASIQANIGTLNDAIVSLERRTKTLMKRVEAGDDNAQKSAGIKALKAFFVDVKTRWSKLEDRVVGYVVWAPPISVNVPPHRYTRDLCVIKLDKKKFRKFRGNVLSLGPEISATKFKTLMYDRIDVPSEFEYPDEGLLPVQGMLSAVDINNLNGKNLDGERIRRVIKRGFITGHYHRYLIWLADPPHDNHSIAFSRGGDSGALIVDALGRFVALLTSGANKGTGANLYFDDLEGFLADVV